VAISGSTALIGADGKRGTGAAYVFVQSGTTWSQQTQLTASDTARNDAFGDSVAILGSTAVIGAPNNSGTGAAYVFVHSGRSWTEQTKLTASDGVSGDRFGSAVAIYGLEAIVGAPFRNGEIGAAYVFAPL
jgi:hypothetical protein